MSHAHHMMNNMSSTTMAMMMGNHSGHHGNMSMGMTSTVDPHAGHAGHGGHMGQESTTMDHSGHDMGGGSGDHSGHVGAQHSMQMFFHLGLSEYILFETLYTKDVGGLVGACFAMFVLSVAYEGLKYFREFLLRKASTSARREMYTPSNSNGGVLTKQPEVGARMLSGSHALQTLLHMVQVFISYCLMLVFMTYNVYLCISIIVGAGLGYFLFGWRRAMVVDLNEHCH